MIIKTSEQYEDATDELEELFRIEFEYRTLDEQNRIDELLDAIELWELDNDNID